MLEPEETFGSTGPDMEEAEILTVDCLTAEKETRDSISDDSKPALGTNSSLKSVISELPRRILRRLMGKDKRDTYFKAPAQSQESEKDNARGRERDNANASVSDAREDSNSERVEQEILEENVVLVQERTGNGQPRESINSDDYNEIVEASKPERNCSNRGEVIKDSNQDSKGFETNEVQPLKQNNFEDSSTCELGSKDDSELRRLRRLESRLRRTVR